MSMGAMQLLEPGGAADNVTAGCAVRLSNAQAARDEGSS